MTLLLLLLVVVVVVVVFEVSCLGMVLAWCWVLGAIADQASVTATVQTP